MSIRVPQADLNQGSQRTTSVNSRSESSAGNSAPAAPASGDTLTLTSAAAELLKLEESLAGIPDIDSGRVETIRAAIADGSYRVDADTIVDRLLGIEQELR